MEEMEAKLNKVINKENVSEIKRQSTVKKVIF